MHSQCIPTMEFAGVDLNRIFRADVTVLNKDSAIRVEQSSYAAEVAHLIDEMGRESAIAQKLRTPITTLSKLATSNHRLYIMKVPREPAVAGIIKVGRKRLFAVDGDMVTRELMPLCVLDFYVHASCQRLGYGRRLFDHMLEAEGVSAAQLAYDRPSPKMLPFLHKHFGLCKYTPQGNNFVIFEDYFDPRNAAPPSTPAGVRVDTMDHLPPGKTEEVEWMTAWNRHNPRLRSRNNNVVKTSGVASSCTLPPLARVPKRQPPPTLPSSSTASMATPLSSWGGASVRDYFPPSPQRDSVSGGTASAATTSSLPALPKVRLPPPAARRRRRYF